MKIECIEEFARFDGIGRHRFSQFTEWHTHTHNHNFVYLPSFRSLFFALDQMTQTTIKNRVETRALRDKK